MRRSGSGKGYRSFKMEGVSFGYYTSWKYGNAHEHENIVRVETQEDLTAISARGEEKINEFVLAADFIIDRGFWMLHR